MLHIFEYVRPAAHHDCDCDHGAPSTSLDWLVLTFVCRYWRHLALAHAPLWTSVPVRTPDLLFAFAQRARDQPLELVFEAASAIASKGRQDYMNIGGGVGGGLMGRVQLDMAATVRRMGAWPELGSNIRSLVFLDPSASAHWLKIAQCLPRELPQLEVLRVEGADSGTGSVIEHILGEGTPTLRVLSVTGCSVSPHFCSKCPNLHELRLVRNANLDSLGPDEILGMLQALPRLGTFYLEARVPSPQSHGHPAALLQNQNQAQIPQQHQIQGAAGAGGDLALGHRAQRDLEDAATVRLPELRALTLVHAPRTTAHVLARLALPPAASVSLAFPASDGSVLAAHRADVFARVPALARCTHASVGVHASKVSVRAGFGPRPAGEAECGARTEAVTRADTGFQVQYRRDYDFSQHFAGIPALLPSLTSLSLAVDTGRHGHSIMTSISESGWRRLLGGLSHLTTLAVGSNVSFSHRALFRVLRSGEEHVADGKREWRWHLPKLRTLHFVDLVLREDLCFCGCMEANGEPGEGCSRVQPTAFYARRDKWEYDDEYIDSAAMPASRAGHTEARTRDALVEGAAVGELEPQVASVVVPPFRDIEGGVWAG
ncbi:hypothetical protein EIP86_006755 [Pleurotus ostreatoroseus]|nr:hypothetical protein EIP86_006755 [Pleurotus ostreatoroseus]